MAFKHGIQVTENPTPLVTPIEVDSAIQFVVGTAPINLIANPSDAENKPILVNSFTEAQEKLGFSESFDKFTLCEAMNASFKLFSIKPVVFVNVLNETDHKVTEVAKSVTLDNGKYIEEVEGILLNVGFIVENVGQTLTYVLYTDYTLSFDDNGHVVIEYISTGDILINDPLKISYEYLDTSLVTETDIIGTYISATNTYTGLENIEQVYPLFGKIPSLILAPGYSRLPNVGITMISKTTGINDVFNAMALLDIDTTTATNIADAIQFKYDNAYINERCINLWPKVKAVGLEYHYSSIMGALIATTDANNDGVPFVSPSNKILPISATILEDGTETYLTLPQANELNEDGIVTAINFNGWRSWGNGTGKVQKNVVVDVKDRFIPVRRMFDWQANTFIVSYFSEVDGPINNRLIGDIVNDENVRINGLVAREQLAGGEIVFNADDSNLVDGNVVFIQKFTPLPPAQSITNVLEFDVNTLNAFIGD